MADENDTTRRINEPQSEEDASRMQRSICRRLLLRSVTERLRKGVDVCRLGGLQLAWKEATAVVVDGILG